ncbi:MAG: hypothetical protein ABR511_11090 [Acidimicrobiales bacterium]
MSATSGGDEDLVAVRLISISLDDLRRAAAHHDELFREFALVLGGEPSPGHEVPARLLALIDELNSRFAGFSTAPQAEIDAAMDRGDAAIDVTFAVPAEARAACLRVGGLLAEADDYCRNGELLTLAPPPDAVAFRNWYLDEFVAQIDGADPTPWPEYKARALHTG